jgi:hypothetical protein
MLICLIFFCVVSGQIHKQVSSCFKAVSPFKRGAAFSDTHRCVLFCCLCCWC